MSKVMDVDRGSSHAIMKDTSVRNIHSTSGIRNTPNATPQRRKPINTSTRIYRAPQATIRNERRADGKTRRRRREPVHSSDGDISLEAPWDDDHSDRGHQRQRSSITLRQGHEEFSDSFSHDFDDAFYHHNEYHFERKRNFWAVVRNALTPQTIVQIIVLIVFASMIYDSHTRVQKHRVQLARYDEERAHILEQMMWIDKAAKKVHQKYAQKEIWESLGDHELDKESRDQLLRDAEGLRDEVKKLQLRIQLNARGRIEDRFGQKPASITLNLDEEGTQHLVIGLTDDTPHAAAILLEQYDHHLWDKVELQRINEAVVQVATDNTATSPVLEFVESSHSCHERGSVSLSQLEAESMDLNVLVLRVHMEANAAMGTGDVCIGRVQSGLEHLKREDIPRIVERPGQQP